MPPRPISDLDKLRQAHRYLSKAVKVLYRCTEEKHSLGLIAEIRRIRSEAEELMAAMLAKTPGDEKGY